MDKESKISLFRIYILVGFLIAIIYHYYMSTRYGFVFPYNTFLFYPDDQFMDFVNVYKIKGSVYFPFANLLIYLFTLIKSLSISLNLYLFSTTISIFFIVFKFLKSDSFKNSFFNTLIFTFFTFPFLFLIDRANFESFVSIFLFIFIYFFMQKKYTLSTIPLAFAVSMKLFPILFLLLFIKNKLWKQIFYVFLSIFSITVLSIFILGLNFNSYLLLLSESSKFYTENYVIRDGGLDYGHSIFGLIKGFFLFLKLRVFVPQLLTPYLILVVIVVIYFSYIVVYKINSLWKNSAIIVILFCLLPYVSADYKLIHLLIPILLYINDSSGLNESKQGIKIFTYKLDFDYLYILLFSILLIPKNYRFLGLYDGVLIDPIAMVFLLFILLLSIKKNNISSQNIDSKG